MRCRKSRNREIEKEAVSMASQVGRPRRASKELLQEAAFELFQHRGYRGTSVEQIAKMAGFSRATFFNFFSSKAELFWLETDALIASLRENLEEELGRDEPRELGETLREFATGLASDRIPWALQNYRLLEAADDLIASGASRAIGLNRVFAHYLALTTQSDLVALHARAASTTAILVSATLGWIDAGVSRGDFGKHLARALIH